MAYSCFDSHKHDIPREYTERELYEINQQLIKLEMDAAFIGRDLETMTEKEILEMELSYALMGKNELTIEELMKIPEFQALCDYNGRHFLDDETPEDIKYNKCLQLSLCAKFVHGGLPYSEVAYIFTDVEITEQEYNTLLQDPSTVEMFIRSKGYKEGLD